MLFLKLIICLQLEAAGFNIEAVRQALQAHSGDVLKAIDELLAFTGAASLTQNPDGSKFIFFNSCFHYYNQDHEQIEKLILTT